MKDIGFLGLGIMGGPMARNLIAAGNRVTVWSHNGAKAAAFAQKHGCEVVKTPEEVARRCSTTFLCVGDTAMSRDVILGEQGLVHGAARGSLIADCSTVSPMASKAIGKALAEKGIRFLDSPCTGSKPGAEGGTLSFMIGGEKADFEEARPLFEAMGKTFYYCGPQGSGLHAKMTQNLVLGNIMQAFNEGIVLSTKGGVDPRMMIDILNNTGARSGYVSTKADFVLKGDFSTTFSVRWLEKDLGLALEIAAELGVPMYTTSATQQQLRMARAMGYGEDDICGSIRALEEIASCKVRDAKGKSEA